MNRFEADPHFNPDALPDGENIIDAFEPEIEVGESTTDLEMQAEEKEKEAEKKREEEERLYDKERERRIETAKKEILQKKIDELFEEFSKLLPEDLKSLSNTGKTSGGESFRSSSLGELNMKEATTLAKMILNNEWVIDQILGSLPELSEELNTEVAEEAEEKVDEQLKSEKEAKNNPDKLAEEDAEENPDVIIENSESNPEGASELGAGPENPTA